MSARKTKTKKPLPRFKKLTLHPRPDESVVRAALMIEPPKGYVFLSVERKKDKAVVTFERAGG